jgi:CheY-like chemotaxis protein
MQQDAGNRPVVLVVEDEELLRWNAVAMIEDAGFDVVDAANATEAIAILERRNDIRIIFTDIQMPGSIDGLRLAHLVKNRWPPIKIITTSGHFRVRDDELPEGCRFLSKPYTLAEVTGMLYGLHNEA